MRRAEVSPTFRSLFFEPSGSIVVESSAPREYAIVIPALQFRGPGPSIPDFHFGSLFTQRFCDVLESMEFDDQKKPEWSVVCRQAQERMDIEFPAICPNGVITLGTGQKVFQKRQTISAWKDEQSIAP